MAEAIERLNTLALDFFPLVLAVLDAAFVHVSKPFLTIIATVHEEAAVPKDHGMVRALTWHFSTLKGADIEPLLLC